MGYSIFQSALAFQSQPGEFFDSNADYAHRSFDAHAANFSPALKSLLDANENHVISKVAELLHVTHGEYIGAKLRAKEAAGLG